MSKRTVVIEIDDDLYRELCAAADAMDETFSEFLLSMAVQATVVALQSADCMATSGRVLAAYAKHGVPTLLEPLFKMYEQATR